MKGSEFKRTKIYHEKIILKPEKSMYDEVVLSGD